ncbi:MAG: MerR family transcriptional regulator [Verrucomicrobiales bacterium]|nr:MerR family transcriptional regulator [Verrucomicrobiales bacterium]
MTAAHHPIRVVARLTGLSAHVIRIWEQRYRAVEPQRTPTNRRLYLPEHIERLGLLREVTSGGHSIGQVAQLPTEHLRRLAAEAARRSDGATPSESGGLTNDLWVDECLAAIKTFNARALDATLKRGARDLGALGLLQRVLAPLLQSIGNAWRDGVLTAAHEHFATATIRVFLGNAARPFGSLDQAPVLVVATPAGQVHELGALLVGAMAADLGWQVTYLGASLPAAEIAGAARQCGARAVALSLVYPEDDARLESEFARLREALPPEVTLLVGGRALPAYLESVVSLGAVPIDSLVHLGATLDSLRKIRKTGRTMNPVRLPNHE